MKMTFDIPTLLASRFKASVPKGQRSSLLSRLLERELRSAAAGLEAACKKANLLELDTKDWEKLNEFNVW